MTPPRSAAARLVELAPTLVVLEATGGLESDVCVTLAAQGLPVVVLNPRQFKEFPRATGRLTKTDRASDALLQSVPGVGEVLSRPGSRTISASCATVWSY